MSGLRFWHNIRKFDLVVYVCIVSRVIEYFLWDRLRIVDARKSCSNALYDYVVVALINACISARVRGQELVKDTLLYFFHTEHLTFNMDEFKKKFLCGDGGNSPTLGRMHLDRACVVLTDAVKSNSYFVFSQVSECYGCPYLPSWNNTGGAHNTTDGELSAENSFQVTTRYRTYLEVYRNQEKGPVCKTDFMFRQYGVYNLSLTDCNIKCQDKAVNAYLPLFWAFVILCLFTGLRLTFQAIYRTSIFRKFLVWISLRTEVQNDLTTTFSDTAALLDVTEEQAKSSRRLRSLDCFRGVAISIMIFVNYGGGYYYFFQHSPWNGLTVADLVFPWFMWIMGVSLVISTQSQLRNSVTRSRILRKIVVRSLMLTILGLILNSDGGKNDLRWLRIPGVLQRFGLTYLLVAVPEALLSTREIPPVVDRGSFGWMLDISMSGWQWFLMLITGGFHAAVTFLLPVPGCPTGYLGPGGLADNGSYPNCTGGAAMWVDMSLFGQSHIYQHPTSHNIYGGNTPHDPEGLLGTLNSVVLVWLGVAAGRILLVHLSWQGRVKRWLAFCLLCGLLGACLSGLSKESGVIPVNKNLWSLSFVLVTASFAFLLLSAMYLLIDVFKFWSGSPFHFAGMNSILMYIGHEMVSGMLPWSWKPFSESHAEQLTMNMWGAGLWMLTSYLLYKKRFFFAL